MGRACLRDHGHPWPDRGAGCLTAERRQQGGVAHQPDAPRTHPRSHLLRAGSDPDALCIGVANSKSDAIANPHAHAVALGVGKPVGDRDHERLSDAVPIAGRHADAIAID